MPAGFTVDDFYYILPELVLTAGALLVLVVDLLFPRRDGAVFFTALVTLAVTGGFLLSFLGVDVTVSNGLLAIDGFAIFFKSIFLLSAAVTVLMSAPYLRVEQARPGEYYFLVLCATLGMMFMASGIDLITLFIGLETMAISFYVLAGFLKPNRRSNEAAVKYFLLGAFSLGILLYGMSLLYGITGTTSLAGIADALVGTESTLLLSLTLILVAVFLPTAFIPGITGSLYQQFAVTIAVSVVISSINALTLSPALSALLLRPRTDKFRVLWTQAGLKIAYATANG